MLDHKVSARIYVDFTHQNQNQNKICRSHVALSTASFFADELATVRSFMASFSSFFFSISASLSFSSRDLLNILTKMFKTCVTARPINVKDQNKLTMTVTLSKIRTQTNALHHWLKYNQPCYFIFAWLSLMDLNHYPPYQIYKHNSQS